MLNSISAELMKLKRKKLLIVLVAVALLVYLLIIINALFVGSREVNSIDFRYLYLSSFSLIFIVHIIFLGIIGVSLFGDEYINNTMRQIVTIPIPMITFFLSKIVVVGIFSIFLMMGAAIEITIVGTLAGFIQGFTIQNVLLIFIAFLVDAFSFTLALTPIFFVMAICKRNIILPILSIFVYITIALLPAMGIVRMSGVLERIMAYIYPLGSAGVIHNEFVFRTISAGIFNLIAPKDNVFICIICLVVFTIFFSSLSVFVLKKQEN